MWYFDSLLFLADSDVPRESHCSLQPGPSYDTSHVSLSPLTQVDFDIPETQESEGSQEITSPALRINRGKKRKSTEYDTATFLRHASAALAQKEDECDIFAKHIAHELRKMTQHQREILDPFIYKLLTIGQREQATYNTKIVGYNSLSLSQTLMSG